MASSNTLDRAALDRIAAARSEALRMLNSDSPTSSPDKAHFFRKTSTPSSTLPPKKLAWGDAVTVNGSVGNGSSGKKNLNLNVDTSHADDRYYYEDDDAAEEQDEEECEHPNNYTPGSLYPTSTNEEQDQSYKYKYPTYNLPSNQAKRPIIPFRPTSGKAGIGPIDEKNDVLNGHSPNKVMQELSSHSPIHHPSASHSNSHSTSRSLSPQPQNTPSFSTNEIQTLAKSFHSPQTLKKLKRLVQPTLSKIRKTLKQLINRVQLRGAQLGDADKALTRSFEVFSGRSVRSVSCRDFAAKLNNLSMTWSSFSGDECFGLALSLAYGGDDGDEGGVVSIEDYKRFALNDDNGEEDNGDDDDDDEYNYDIDSTIKKHNPDSLITSPIGGMPPPKSPLEEKFQVLCTNARSKHVINVWGLIDDVFKGCNGKRSEACIGVEGMVFTMFGSVEGRGGGKSKSSGRGSAESDVQEDEMMKQIARDVVKLRSDLSFKETQISSLRSSIKNKQQQNGGGGGGGGGGEEGDSPNDESYRPSSVSSSYSKSNPNSASSNNVHIPGTAQYPFSRTTPSRNSNNNHSNSYSNSNSNSKSNSNSNSNNNNSASQMFSPSSTSTSSPQNTLTRLQTHSHSEIPERQRSAVQVLSAAMGMPDDDECFDRSKSSGIDDFFNNTSTSSSESEMSKMSMSLRKVELSRQMQHTQMQMQMQMGMSTSMSTTISTPDVKRELSFSTGHKRNTGRVASQAVTLRQAREVLLLGPRVQRAPNLDIFKMSRCSSKQNTVAKNVYDGKTGKWFGKGGEKLKNTEATKLFNSRFTDSKTQAFGRACYKTFEP